MLRRSARADGLVPLEHPSTYKYRCAVPESADAEYDVGIPPLSQALLDTPYSTGDLLTRPRLIARLDDATHGRLTIISGEPAAGKTSVVLDWLRSDRGRDRPVGWLTVALRVLLEYKL